MTPTYNIEIIGQNDQATRFRLTRNESHLSFGDVFELWQTEIEFTRFYIRTLINLNYKAFYWEHPALKKEFLDKKYECIVQKSRPLEHLSINEKAFKDYIHDKNDVADFMNLGRNARLVVPTKKSKKEIYNHMSKFLRLADEKQVLAIFQKTGMAMEEEIKQQKIIWLNTAGLGVIWLHIRMDTRPKYYKTVKYKNPTFLQSIKE